jgi:hypothetical protein
MKARHVGIRQSSGRSGPVASKRRTKGGSWGSRERSFGKRHPGTCGSSKRCEAIRSYEPPPRCTTRRKEFVEKPGPFLASTRSSTRWSTCVFDPTSHHPSGHGISRVLDIQTGLQAKKSSYLPNWAQHLHQRSRVT